MGIIATDVNEIKLYYNSNNRLGKQAYAYVQSSAKNVFGIDTSVSKITGSQWSEIASKLNISIKELINTAHPDFIAIYGEDKIDVSEHDWLRILEKHHETLADPILNMGDTYRVLQTPSELVQYFEPNSTDKDVRQQ